MMQNSFCMAPDQIPPIPVLRYRRAVCLACDAKPGSNTVLLSEDACWGYWDVHCTPCHPTCPSCLGRRPQIRSKPNWYSFERSIWLFGSSTEVILVIWEFLLHLSRILDIERIPGILMSQFLGMRNVKKLKSVCTCKGSLKFVGLGEKKNKKTSLLKKKKSSKLYLTYIRG